MESGWDALRVLGAVTVVYLLLWAACGAGYTVYVYLLPQACRGAPWLRARGAWAGKRQELRPTGRSRDRRNEDR